jgi:hypothetical protein
MTETLAGGWTLEKLKAQTPEQRYNLWTNARRIGTPEALKLALFIESSGLNYAERGGISMTDPRVIEMWEIINSPGGRRACVEANDKGLPALAGVEPLIIAKMGERYGSFSQMTVTAGSLVAEVMYGLGYKKGPSRPMPEGSVAKTAVIWLRK